MISLLTENTALDRYDSCKNQGKMMSVIAGNKGNIDVFYAVLLLKVLFSYVRAQGTTRFF